MTKSKISVRAARKNGPNLAPPQTPKMTHSNPITFKTLRIVDVNTLATKPLELTPNTVHFKNANGGLRLVDFKEIRELASNSAHRLMEAELGVE